LAGHHGFIMLMSAMGVPQFIVCASFHDVHRVRIVSSCAHRFIVCASFHDVHRVRIVSSCAQKKSRRDLTNTKSDWIFARSTSPATACSNSAALRGRSDFTPLFWSIPCLAYL
jgi:hypothetical protein